jgi:transposase
VIGLAGPEILVRVSTLSDKQPSVPAGGSARRVFTPAYKLAMVAEDENISNASGEEPGPGEKGASLRREGLYSSRVPVLARTSAPSDEVVRKR